MASSWWISHSLFHQDIPSLLHRQILSDYPLGTPGTQSTMLWVHHEMIMLCEREGIIEFESSHGYSLHRCSFQASHPIASLESHNENRNVGEQTWLKTPLSPFASLALCSSVFRSFGLLGSGSSTKRIKKSRSILAYS